MRSTGWWTVLNPARAEIIEGVDEFEVYCASCHGPSGDLLPEADLTDPVLISSYTRSNRLLSMLREGIDGAPHVQDPPLPEDTNEALEILAPVTAYLSVLSGETDPVGQELGFRNYADAIVGYKGTRDYISDCQEGVESTLTKFQCSVVVGHGVRLLLRRS